MAQRKDNKGRKLRTGEYYDDKNKRYIYRKMVDGQRVNITAPDLSELRVKENEILSAIDRGQKLSSRNDKMTLNEYFEFWEKIYAKSNIKATTLTNYKSYYCTYIKGDLGLKKIRNITKTDIQIVFNKMVTDGRKHSTMCNLKSCLNSILECAVDDDIIMKNPAKNIKVPKTDSSKREAVSSHQVELFMEYVKDSKHYGCYYPMFVVLFNTGLRIGELIGLTWSDIDFKNDTISVNKTMNRYRKADYGFTMGLGTPKSDDSLRTIIMNTTVRKALRSEMIKRKQIKLELPFVSDTGVVTGTVKDFVFINNSNFVWSEPTFRELIRRIVKMQNKEVEGTNKEKLEYFCPHQSRHTFTSFAYTAGVDVKAVSDMLGHASTSVTMDVYAHLTEEKMKQQKALVNEIKIS